MSEDPGPYVLLQVRLSSGKPSLKACAARLGMPLGKLDPDFGVVEIDAASGEFAVRALLRDVPPDLPSECGPFADPSIGPMGPLQ